MKTRVTITLEPSVIRKAKQIARARRTNLSALIEQLLTQTAQMNTRSAPSVRFSQKWRGKFELRMAEQDGLLQAMKERYGLNDQR